MINQYVENYNRLAETAFNGIFVPVVWLHHVLDEIFGQVTPEIKDTSYTPQTVVYKKGSEFPQKFLIYQLSGGYEMINLM